MNFDDQYPVSPYPPEAGCTTAHPCTPLPDTASTGGNVQSLILILFVLLCVAALCGIAIHHARLLGWVVRFRSWLSWRLDQASQWVETK